MAVKCKLITLSVPPDMRQEVLDAGISPSAFFQQAWKERNDVGYRTQVAVSFQIMAKALGPQYEKLYQTWKNEEAKIPKI